MKQIPGEKRSIIKTKGKELTANAEVCRVQSKVQEVYIEHFIRAMSFFFYKQIQYSYCNTQ